MKRLRKRLLKLGMGATHRLRGASGAAVTDFRADAPRKQPLALIWAMGVDWSDAEALERLERVRENGEVVVVTDTDDITPLVDRGGYVELLPVRRSRDHLPMLDWVTYIDRRMARIRNAWRADMELKLGQGPEAFLARLRAEPKLDAADPAQTEDLYDPPG